MDLKELYSLRKDFTLIGLTGRTGSGCSRIAELLSSDFATLTNGLRDENELEDLVFKRKYGICKSFLQYKNNWVPFTIIKYIDVLLFYILNKYGKDDNSIAELFLRNYNESKDEENRAVVDNLLKDIHIIDTRYSDTIQKIRNLGVIQDILEREKLLALKELFWGQDFANLKKEIYAALTKHGYYRSRRLFHKTAYNIRKTGDPYRNDKEDIKNIFSIAKIINRLIKAKRVANNFEPTKIVIDSLRNSLEMMFFKERYAAFYMVATKDIIENSRKHIISRLITKEIPTEDIELIADKIIKLDSIEYRTNDFQKGDFAAPDVENCIQKSDYHMYHLAASDLDIFIREQCDSVVDGFYTTEEQLLKLISLIHLPGIITPSPMERAMQIAHIAELNSGCVSRRVGAVITDRTFSVKSIGWNDVPKGQIPCNLRCFTNFFDPSIKIEACAYLSDFEKGKISGNSSYKYKGEKVNSFPLAVDKYFKEQYDINKDLLNGRNTPFCFKTIHNFFEGEANQVHTKSLHAEENAMLQITKNGGIGVDGGFLFTTASPCELCSKKAYQIGITKIFYIDPYPGISKDQIINCGISNMQPKLVPFLGAIGNVYHKLYELFVSQKDEISMILELHNGHNLAKKIKNVLSDREHSDIIEYINSTDKEDRTIINILKLGIEKQKANSAINDNI